MLQILIGGLSGIFSGIGMGGGTILILLLGIFTNLEQHLVQGTNLIVFIPVSIIAILINIKNKKIDYKISFQIIIFGMIGAFIGSMLAFKFNNRILKKFFGIFLLIIGFLEICSFKYRLPKKEDNKIK